jgi:hypothetical protein
MSTVAEAIAFGAPAEFARKIGHLSPPDLLSSRIQAYGRHRSSLQKAENWS